MAEYKKYLISESFAGKGAKEKGITKMIERVAKQKVKNVDKKLHVVFKMNKPIDEEDFDNFDIIDSIVQMLEKMYPGAIVKHDWDKFIVKEL